jgi:hypothetical protein
MFSQADGTIDSSLTHCKLDQEEKLLAKEKD